MPLMWLTILLPLKLFVADRAHILVDGGISKFISRTTDQK